MKSPYLVFFLAIAAALLGLGASFVSAPKYGYLFAIIIACELVAVACLVYGARFGSGWKMAALLPSIVVIYTVADVVARAFFGMRVLDILR